MARTQTQTRPPVLPAQPPAEPERVYEDPVFSVVRLSGMRFQPTVNGQAVGEPMIYEALAYQHLAGQVLRYWELECVRRTRG